MNELEILSDAKLEESWAELGAELEQTFGKKMGLEGTLFMMGVQEAGVGFKRHLEKEAKQDLILEGTYHALAALGFYTRTTDGWQPTASLPKMQLNDQEKLLKTGVLRYFGK
jgi:hypothetical protein